MIVLLLLLGVVGYLLYQALRPNVLVLPPTYWAGVARQDSSQGPI